VTTTSEMARTKSAPAPSVKDLEKLTTVTLSDLMRAGSAETKQSIRAWGSEQGGNACALSAAMLALEKLEAR
jgi:predicted nucleic acid-binding Zn ribbon protein